MIKVIGALSIVTLLFLSNGCIPTTGVTIYFNAPKGNVESFSFYQSVENVIENAGFRRVEEKGEKGSKVFLRYEDKEFIISSFKPSALLPGQGVVGVSVYYRKKNGDIELTLTQYPAHEFTAETKRLLEKLVSTLREKFGAENVSVETKPRETARETAKNQKTGQKTGDRPRFQPIEKTGSDLYSSAAALLRRFIPPYLAERSAERLLRMPEIVGLLHAQLDERTVTEELAQAQRHLGGDALFLDQQFMDGLTRYAECPRECRHCQV